MPCFILWGSRSLTTTLSSGHFFCPRCQDTRSYSMRPADHVLPR
jgi:hypothetical protein